MTLHIPSLAALTRDVLHAAHVAASARLGAARGRRLAHPLCPYQCGTRCKSWAALHVHLEIDHARDGAL